MGKINLTNNYSLLVAKEIKTREIIAIIEGKLGKKVASCMGLRFSYNIVVRNQDDSYETTLEVSTKIINNVFITTISEDVDSEEAYGQEVFGKEPKILSAFCSEYQGILLVKCYKTITYSKLDKTYYSINFDKNSIDYKLIELLIDDTRDVYATLAFAEILKNKRSELLEIIK